MNRSPASQTNLQKVISLTLRSGVLLAGVVGLIGGLLFLLHHGADTVNFGHFVGTSSPFASPASILSGLRSDNDAIRSLSITQVGILLLLLTPISRVAFSIIGFALERDRLYVAITSAVLLTLIASVLLH